MLENKLNAKSSAKLAREEERISKIKAVELFEKGILDSFPAVNFPPYRQFIDSCLRIFMDLLEKYAQ